MALLFQYHRENDFVILSEYERFRETIIGLLDKLKKLLCGVETKLILKRFVKASLKEFFKALKAPSAK